MKKILFLSLLISLVSFNSFAQMGSAYNSVRVKFSEMTGSTGNEVCLDDGTGVLKKVNRPTWELGFRSNFLDIPNGADVQFQLTNYDLVLYHNLGTSNSMYAYASYGERSITKTHYEGQEFEDEWKNKQLFGGFGIYLTPSITAFAGIGKIIAEDKEGNEAEIGMAIERGIAVDMPMFGNKLRLEYRAISAGQKGDVEIEKSTGDAGFSALSLTFVVGL